MHCTGDWLVSPGCTAKKCTGSVCEKETVYANRRIWETLDRPWRPFSASKGVLCVLSVCSYERERPARVKTIHVKGVDNATAEDRERYLYKPTFKPLWCAQVSPSYTKLGFL